MRKFRLFDLWLIFLFLLSVYFILTRIFGHSATNLTIMIGLFIFLSNIVFNLNREFGEFKTKTINSFDRAKEDMGELKQDMSDLKQDMGDLKQNMIEIKGYVKK